MHCWGEWLCRVFYWNTGGREEYWCKSAVKATRPLHRETDHGVTVRRGITISAAVLRSCFFTYLQYDLPIAILFGDENSNFSFHIICKYYFSVGGLLVLGCLGELPDEEPPWIGGLLMLSIWASFIYLGTP